MYQSLCFCFIYIYIYIYIYMVKYNQPAKKSDDVFYRLLRI